MIKESVATGATIEEAQQTALLALNAPINAEVQFEVISFPEKKVFGLFGGKKAEVRAFYEAEDEEVKSEPEKVKKAPKKEKTPKKEAAPKKKENCDEVKKEKSAPIEEEKIEELPKNPISIDDCPDGVKKAYEYLNTIIAGIGVSSVKIEVFNREKDYFFDVDSEEDYSILIGRRGETLDSIQYLVRLAANRGSGEDNFSKISINVGNYRQKREVTLQEIARKTANKVKKYGRNIALDPMNPFERRIIHTEISNIPDVISYSVGSDGDRKVVIALEEGVKPTQPRKSYGNRGGYNRGRGGRNNSRRNDDSATVESPSRPPRSDASDFSRYGKIEPKNKED